MRRKRKRKKKTFPTLGLLDGKSKDDRKKTRNATGKTVSPQLEMISRHFHKDILPLCVQFAARLQMEPVTKKSVHIMLRELVMNVMFQLNVVKANEDPEDSTKRRR
jgi:predicted TIM-barrel enzyme